MAGGQDFPDFPVLSPPIPSQISITTLKNTTRAPPEMAPPTLHLATTHSVIVQWQCAEDCLVGKFELQYMKIQEVTAATPTSQVCVCGVRAAEVS